MGNVHLADGTFLSGRYVNGKKHGEWNERR